MVALGVVFRPQHEPELLRPVAQLCDAGGIDELWLWEDCFDHGGIATASAALAWTERLGVGIGVLPVPLRNVAVTAMELASLERMFPGRVRAGIGHGVQDWMSQVGARAASPMTLLREYTAALQALLAGDTVTVAGEYVRLEDVHLGWAPAEKPALSVGGIRPKTLALAGSLGDGVVLTSGTGPDLVAAARRAVDDARGAAHASARVTVYVGTSPGQQAVGDAELGGDGTAIAAGVRRFAGAGADAVVLQSGPDDDPREFARFVADEVRPQVG